QTLAVSGTKNMIEHLRDVHRIDKDGPMDSEYAVNQCIDHAFGNAKQRIQFNLDMFRQLLLRWKIVNHIAFPQVEDNAFRVLLFYLLAYFRLFSLRTELPKSRNTIRSWIMTLFESPKIKVVTALADLPTRIHFSFH
ncbi:hypothetical protein K440DRAFT_573567, partial [Wilcoxina mikolae CBS 423.85]